MQSPRVFFGWWVTLAFALVVFVSTGVRFAVGPFLKPMVADLHLDRASFSLVVSLGLFLYGFFMPLVGRLVDRFGARPVVTVGALVLAASTASTGLVARLWQFALLYGVVMAAGLAATGHVVATAVVSRWFTRRRATALSVLGGAAMGGMGLLVPLAMWLILAIGWRATYGVMGLALALVMLPIALWVVRDSPESMGLRPDGAPAGPAAPVTAGAERTLVVDAVRTRPFWQLSLTLATCGFTMSLLSAHGVPMLTDHGYDPMFASWTVGMLGATSVAFSLLLGVIADGVGCRPVLAWIYGGRALALAGLFLIRDHPAALLLVAVLGGATMAGSFAMTSTLTASIFGRYSVGSVFGTIFLIHQTGAALGSWLAGALFELSEGYGAAFALAGLALAAASLGSLAIDERPRAAVAAGPGGAPEGLPARGSVPIAGGH